MNNSFQKPNSSPPNLSSNNLKIRCNTEAKHSIIGRTLLIGLGFSVSAALMQQDIRNRIFGEAKHFNPSSQNFLMPYKFVLWQRICGRTNWNMRSHFPR